MKRYTWLLVGLLWLLGGWQANATCRPAAPTSLTAAAPQQLLIATQNLWLFHDAHKNFRYDKALPAARVTARINAIADYIIKRLGSPDILALQEVENRRLLERLATAITAAGGPTYQVYFEGHQDVGGNGVALLTRSRIKIGGTRSRFSTLRIPEYHHAKTFSRLPLEVTITAPISMQLLVVHLRSANGLKSASKHRYVVAKRRAQTQALVGWAARQKNNWMVLGDFNSGPAKGQFGAPWRRLHAARWREVAAAHGNYSYSYHCKRRQLDHIYLSTGLWSHQPRAAFAHGNAGRYRQLYSRHGTQIVSDHDGLGVYLRIGEK